MSTATQDSLLVLASEVHERTADVLALLASGAEMPPDVRLRITLALRECRGHLEAIEAEVAEVDPLAV